MTGWSALVFMVAATCAPLSFAQATPASRASISDEHIVLRGDFQNARVRFQQTGRGHVAFMGGSITEMNGYRPLVMEQLQRRYPKTKFTFTDAGIASTCSTTGAFRLADHVLDQGPVDLFFVEFAVNDDQDAGHAFREALRGMEGIVRHTRRHNPHADIVITYFVNPGMLRLWQAGQTPTAVRAHEKVAAHYQIPAIHLGRQVARSITAGELTWEQFGGTHPKPRGNRIAARMIERLMDMAANKEAPAGLTPHPLPEPLDANSYFRGRLVDVATATVSGDAAVKIPQWKQLGGGFRDRFADTPLLCLEGVSGECQLQFSGTAVGAYVLAGPDAARVAVSIDGGASRVIDLYHRFSKGLHYPRTVMFATDLENGDHRLTLRVAESTVPARRAARILHFVAN